MGESSPVKGSCSLTNSTRTPLRSGPAREHVSHRGCVRAGPYCVQPQCPLLEQTAVVPRAVAWLSLPEALSVKTRSKTRPSSWRFLFWSSVLTRAYPICCPLTAPPTLVLSGWVPGSFQKKVKAYRSGRQVGRYLHGHTTRLVGAPSDIFSLSHKDESWALVRNRAGGVGFASIRSTMARACSVKVRPRCQLTYTSRTASL
jgi:hypothetical protein